MWCASVIGFSKVFLYFKITYQIIYIQYYIIHVLILPKDKTYHENIIVLYCGITVICNRNTQRRIAMTLITLTMTVINFFFIEITVIIHSCIRHIILRVLLYIIMMLRGAVQMPQPIEIVNRIKLILFCVHRKWKITVRYVDNIYTTNRFLNAYKIKYIFFLTYIRT